MLLILLILLTMPTVSFAAGVDYNSLEFRAVISQLDMQGHADHELSTCTVKKVYYDEVLDMLKEGKSEDDIIKSYVNEYGQAALRTPGNDLNGVIAWVMPAVALVIGTIIVTRWIKRIALRENKKELEIINWNSETDQEIFEKTIDEERRKFF